MKSKNRLHIVKALFIVGIVVSGYVQAENTRLKVGLYPYVPRIEQFKTAMQTQWNAIQPDVDLVFDAN